MLAWWFFIMYHCVHHISEPNDHHFPLLFSSDCFHHSLNQFLHPESDYHSTVSVKNRSMFIVTLSCRFLCLNIDFLHIKHENATFFFFSMGMTWTCGCSVACCNIWLLLYGVDAALFTLLRICSCRTQHGYFCMEKSFEVLPNN